MSNDKTPPSDGSQPAVDYINQQLEQTRASLGLKGGASPSATSLERFTLSPEKAGSFLGWETVMKLRALGYEVAEPIS